jgi:hypothetical protein
LEFREIFILVDNSLDHLFYGTEDYLVDLLLLEMQLEFSETEGQVLSEPVKRLKYMQHTEIKLII